MYIFKINIYLRKNINITWNNQMFISLLLILFLFTKLDSYNFRKNKKCPANFIICNDMQKEMYVDIVESDNKQINT